MSEMTEKRSAKAPEFSNWGRWGENDERGALNLITPEVVTAALASSKTGKVYNLAVPIQRRGSAPIFAFRNPPQRLSAQSQSDVGSDAPFGAPEDLGSNEDVLILDSHGLTHMDALAHVYIDGSIYNGFSIHDITTKRGVPNCGIDKVGQIVTRGVHLDLPRHQGVDWLEPGTVISSTDLQACADAQGVSVRSGDMVMVRTGFLEWWRDQGKPSMPASQPGLGLDSVHFFADNDVAVVGCDNSAIEVMPFDQDVFLGVHLALLRGLGVHLIEHMNLAQLSADQITECLMVVAPLNVRGAAGSPVSPIAIA